MKRLLLTTIAFAALAGCSLAPDYEKPPVPEPTAFKETGNWTEAKPSDAIERGAWWKIFHDPDLDMLEDGVTAANQNLKSALAQYEQARAAASAARSAYFPTITGGAGGMRERESQAVINSPPKPTFYDFTFGADLTYEIDIWVAYVTRSPPMKIRRRRVPPTLPVSR
jgi:outer membrane protein TolC